MSTYILTQGTMHQVDKFKKDKGQYMMMVKVMVIELFIFYYSAMHCRPLHLGSPAQSELGLDSLIPGLI